MSSYMYNYLTLEFICAIDGNIGHSVVYDIKGVLIPSVLLELESMSRAQL